MVFRLIYYPFLDSVALSRLFEGGGAAGLGITGANKITIYGNYTWLPRGVSFSLGQILEILYLLNLTSRNRKLVDRSILFPAFLYSKLRCQRVYKFSFCGP
jgi:hypothetical protein